MFVIYIRQLFVVMHALHTNILPLARDVCTFNRWGNNEAEHLRTLPFLTRVMFRWAIIVDPQADIQKVSAKYCQDEEKKYERLQNSDVVRLLEHYPGLFAVAITMVFAFNERIMRKFYANDEDFHQATMVRYQTYED